MSRPLTVAFLTFVLTSVASAATYPPELRWRTIRTEHFRIHFHNGEEELAARTADMAERIHDRIAPILDHVPAGGTDIVLTDHVDVSNGSATPFPTNRIELYVSAPGADPSSPLEFYDNWLEMVLTHEYAHILHLDQARGWWRAWRKVFGRNPTTFPNAFSPLWITEGLATLIESEATDAGRLKGTFVDMVLRTAALEGRWPSAAQAAGHSPEWPGGSSRYFYGSKFLAWMAGRYGQEKLAAYFHDYAGNFIPFNVDGSARSVFGTSMTRLWREWSEEQQRVYREQVSALGALTESERITSRGYETRYPAVSPDGGQLAYAHEGPTEQPTIRVRDLRNGRDVSVLRVNSTSRPVWSADGRMVAFSQLELHRTFSLLSDVYVWEPENGRLRRVTRGARVKEPAFTPQGTLVAVHNRAGRNRLVEISPDSGAVRVLVEPQDFTQFAEPSVSPDGKTIAVAEWLRGRIDIVLYSREGERLRNLTATMPRSTNASPRFSPDGATVLFSSDVTGVSNIYRASTAGGPPERMSNVAGGAFFPDTHAGRIYFTNYSSRGFDLASFVPDRALPVVPRTIPPTLMGNRFTPPLESTPATHESQPYSPLRSALPRWWFPLLEVRERSDGDDEVAVGAVTSGADVLGHHAWDLQFLRGTGDDTDTDYVGTYSYNRWYPTFTAVAAGGHDTAAGVGIVSDGVRHVYRDRVDRALALVTFPWRTVERQFSITAGAAHNRIRPDLPFAVSDAALASAGIFEGSLQGLRLSASFNNTRRYGFSVSPEDGVTALLSYENMSESLGSDASVRQVRGDIRAYRSVPVGRSSRGHHVLATRIAAGRTSGDYVLQRELRAGGTGAGGFAALDILNFPVRGFNGGTLRGSDALIASVEYRFPIWEIDRGPGVLPVFFRRIFGDVFYDTGTAWNRRDVTLPVVTRRRSDPFGDDNTISSAGAELSIDLYVGFVSPLRYRAGAAYLLEGRGEGDVTGYITVGSSF